MGKFHVETDRDEAGTTTVTVRGDVDMASAPSFSRALDEVADADHLVVDLREVTFIDSTGLGVLVRAHRELGDRGPLLVRCNPGPVRRVLEVSGVDQAVRVIS